MARHFVHYLPRKITSLNYKETKKLFYDENQNQEDGFDRPMYHITKRSSGPAKDIVIGDVIWLFSTLKSPWGTLPPSLDAKIIVSNVEPLSEDRTKFHASKDSAWFPMSNASDVIENIK